MNEPGEPGRIIYGGIYILETQTWEQLGISDDATLIVDTDKKVP